MMATNVRGPVVLTKLAMPYLVEARGNVINISSAVGIIPSESVFAYAMSKAALDHFTRCAAMELAGTYQISHKRSNFIFSFYYLLFVYTFPSSSSTRELSKSRIY